MFPEISLFPKELEDVIIDQLSPFDILNRVSLVCKHWNVIANDENLWNSLYFKKFDLLISSKNTWKEQFKDVYQAHLSVDGLYQNVLRNIQIYKHILDIDVESTCRSLGICVANFRWVRSNKVVERIPIFVMQNEKRSEIRYENIRKKSVKNFSFSLILANEKNFNNLLVEKEMSLERDMMQRWPMLLFKEEIVVERIKIIEALLNDKLQMFVDIAHKNNFAKLSSIKDWNVSYYLTFDVKGKIKEVSERLEGMNYISGFYLGRIKCTLQGDIKFYEWGVIDCYDKADTKQESLIYQSMEKTIMSLNRLNKDALK